MPTQSFTDATVALRARLDEQSRYHGELAEMFADEQKYDSFVKSLDDSPYSLVASPSSSTETVLEATLYDIDENITSYV